jgi:uncharacterized membrane protein (TIGR01218 family)
MESVRWKMKTILIELTKANTRYCLATANEKHYLVDLDKPIIVILFPILNWIIPKRGYAVNEIEYKTLKYQAENDKKTFKISPVLAGGIAVLFSQIIPSMPLGTSKLVNIGILSMLLVTSFFIRLQLSSNSLKKFSRYYKGQMPTLFFTVVPPKKYIVKIILFQFFMYLISIVGMYLIVQDNDIITIIVAMMIFQFCLWFNIFYLPRGEYLIKYLKYK